MSMFLLCSSCHRNLKIPDNIPGQKVKCPLCGTVLTLPAPQRMLAPSGDSTQPTPVPLAPPARKFRWPLLLVALGGGALAILLLTTLLILIFSFFGPNSTAQVSRNAKNPNGVDFTGNQGKQGQDQQPPKTGPVLLKADLKVTAAELLAVVQANQLDAERKYQGKLLEVTGLVGQVDRALLPELDPQYFVWLQGSDKSAGSLRCGFSTFFAGFPALESGPHPGKEDEELNRKDGAGISVTILGRFEWASEPRLVACTMLTSEAEIITQLNKKAMLEKDAFIQAEQAAEEAVKKASALKVQPSDLATGNAKSQFGGKVVEITALVKGVRKGKYDAKSGERLILDLEWDKKPEVDHGPVACSFSLRHTKLLVTILPGQTVTIRGRCDEMLPDFLWHCSLIKAD